MQFDYPQGATPLDPDEAEGLRLTHITTREELNIFEAENIRTGMEWAWRSRRKDIVSESFICLLHKKMFGNVWKWAGKFRQSNKNIGVAREMIGIELRHLCEDVNWWIEHKTFVADEIAARFHHRLVAIHPFANGNGRHARMLADLLLEKRLGQARFSWGGEDIADANECRVQYVRALQAADRGDYAPLLQFVRS
ncbi:mobile mystery protein B [Mariprofundus ferrinatatus]|uniref:Mobile mystery protein B n=1 Tax=Mariprofundus ferrinatatus TaxID=1921087 RepID=A0A2K8L3P8_9PROT|nr:mobile mystery protein B [Mariprofundus ferrinatatus]ATX81907.1 mobile mystery protein B [Mariprofundus ferrinatatus]